jgi:hypothetical protein
LTSLENRRRQWSKKFLRRRGLVLFGLEVRGHGKVVGCGKEAIGIAHRIRVLSGFRTDMFIKMEDMYSFAVGGDDALITRHQ